LQTSDEEETLAALSQARAQLHDQLSKIEFDDKKHDAAVNSISLIIRTLDKIEQMTKSLRQEQVAIEDEINREAHDKLREKVKTLILAAAKREQKQK
jgi:hypothetical protein